MQLMPCDNPVKNFHQVRVEHIHPGEVDGYRHDHAVPAAPGGNLPGSFFPYIVIQFGDLPALLKQRDKIGR